MELAKIVEMWDKDSKIDETELGSESTKIPQTHNKYMKIYIGERATFFKMQGQLKRLRRLLGEYYLGELDRDELERIGREQYYKKLLKNEIENYVESDEEMIEMVLKVSMQEEKVRYLEAIIKSLTNRGFAIKNAIEWLKFTSG
jgi:hypothetical protein